MCKVINKNSLIIKVPILVVILCLMVLCSNEIFATSTQNNVVNVFKIVLPIVIPIIFAFIARYLEFKYGENSSVTKINQEYPPKEYNSAEVGFFYKGNIASKDIITLVIHLANKGYLRIEDDTVGLLIKSKSYKFIKLKEYDGNDKIECEFFERLFENRNETTFIDLKYSFIMTLKSIKLELKSKESKSRIFSSNSTLKMILIGLMILATNILITVKLPMSNDEASMLIFGLIFPITGFVFLIVGMSNRVYGRIKRDLLIMGGVFSFIGINSVFMLCAKSIIYGITYIIGLICVYIMTNAMLNLKKRTQFGNEILGKLEGYVQFIKTAPRHKLEELTIQDSNYFYESLPYVHALGVSDIFIRKLQNISAFPMWYNGSEKFDFKTFSRLTEKCMTSDPQGIRGPDLPW